MALYYNLGPLYATYQDNQELIKEKLTVFTKQAELCLDKMKEGIAEKKYNKVKKQTSKLMPFLELLGMDAALEDAYNIESWIEREGKKKEVKEIFKSFKTVVKSAVKELKKDFSL